MSRSSPRSDRDRGRRAQTEPTAALAAVLAVVLGLGTYAVVVVDAGGRAGSEDRSLAPPTLDRVHDRLVAGGVAAPAGLPDATAAAGPDGYGVNATLTAAGRAWTAGPAAPSAVADRASRPVAVRVGPGRVRAGALRVVVWS